MVVGRFQVMAVLQAARAFVLGLPEASAKSWGLNRAIFYAAAKRGFRGRLAAPVPRPRPRGEVHAKPILETPEEFHLGDEVAFKAPKVGETLYFTIGGKVQTERGFERQIEARFGGRFGEAWEEAVKLVQQFDREVLLSQHKFYQQVYKPNRDILAAKWSEMLKR